MLSDLHLGEDVKPYSVTYLRHLARLEHELEDFLEYYTSSRIDGRPWRLIINGDMVDFMSICLLPSSADGEGVTEDERKFGLGSGPRQTRRKLEEVIRRHPGVFRKMALFVAASNELVVVLGNHDVEFYWDEVQVAFKEALGRFAAEAGESADSVAARISFHPWFYYEPDFLYVEHGHQYDHYCSFDYILNPVAPRVEDGIVLSAATAAMRYFCNLIPDLDPHSNQEEWSLLRYLRWAVGRGVRGFVRVVQAYCLMMWRMLSVWRDLRREPHDLNRRRTHLSRLRSLAEQYRMDEETLLRLEALKSPSVLRDGAGLVRMLLIDRVALGLVWFLGAVLALAYAPSGYRSLAILLLTAAAFLGNRYLAKRLTLVGSPMNSIPEMIRRIVRVPLIVFGHSHDPVVEALPSGGWYVNTGTWVASERPGLLHAFTHLVIRHAPEGPRAELCQWRNGASAAYGPHAPVLRRS